MVFKTGDKRPEGAGRKPGSPNKFNMDRMVLSNYIGKILLEDAVKWGTTLAELRTKNPTLYLKFILQFLRLSVPVSGLAEFPGVESSESDEVPPEGLAPPKALSSPPLGITDQRIEALLAGQTDPIFLAAICETEDEKEKMALERDA